jgi:hypothetical protein
MSKRTFMLGFLAGATTSGYTFDDFGDSEDSYLVFYSISPFSLSIFNNNKNWDGELFYSTDKKNW